MTLTVRALEPPPVQRPDSVALHIADCYLRLTPNRWDCHDPQCDDSTWDHECPTPPCWVGRSEPLQARDRVGASGSRGAGR